MSPKEKHAMTQANREQEGQRQKPDRRGLPGRDMEGVTHQSP